MLRKRISFQMVSKVLKLSGIPRVIQSTNVSSPRMLGSVTRGGGVNRDTVVLLWQAETVCITFH